MDITLITPTPPDINAFGIRTISSVLKESGFSTKVVFLPGGIENLRFDGSYIYRYSEKTLRRILELCGDSDLIGFSFMSQYFDRAAQLTEYLKNNISAPIIWGGIHPTYRPEQSLNFCDIVCIGEGERVIIDLVRKISSGEDYTMIDGCWFKTDGKITKNMTGAIVHNLDELPFVDYEISNHYVYDRRSEEIVRVDEDTMKKHFLRLPYFNYKHLTAYRTMTSRGCPHRCSYCASSAMMQMRRRSVDNVIEELSFMIGRFDYIELISFFDDTFFAAPVEYFEEFRDKYKKRIGLPFHAQCSPSTITKNKMQIMVDAGLYSTEMGIQTGSEKTKKMYRRKVSNARILDAASIINSYSHKMLTPEYHVILDNPWEDKQDVLDTLNLLLAISGKFRLQISSLVFFPGTELNDKARSEGLLKDELHEVCRKPFTFPTGTYLNYLIYLSGFPSVPRWAIKLLADDRIVGLLHTFKPKRIYSALFFVSEKIRLMLKGVQSVFMGDFNRIINYFRLAR